MSGKPPRDSLKTCPGHTVRHSFGSSPDLPLDAKGLLAGVLRSTVPFVHPRSCLADSAPGTVELHSSPMAYMALSCVEEMSEEAFLIVASLQLGLPQRVLELPELAHDASDRRIDSTWADLALNSLSLKGTTQSATTFWLTLGVLSWRSVVSRRHGGTFLTFPTVTGGVMMASGLMLLRS